MNQEYYSIKTHLTSFTIICRATMHHYTKPCSLGQTLTAWSGQSVIPLIEELIMVSTKDLRYTSKRSLVSTSML